VRPRFGGAFSILNASVGEGLKPLLYGIILKETPEAPIFTAGDVRYRVHGSRCKEKP
jgi:hypothetical protein